MFNDKHAQSHLERLATMLAAEIGHGLGQREEVWERHVMDSLAAASELPARGRVADVGSGLGLPGLPLAIAHPFLAFTLVEPRGERVRWLRHTVDELALPNVEVVKARWVDVPTRRYQLAVARALAKPDAAIRLLRAGPPVDRLVLFLSRRDALGRPGVTMLDNGRALLSMVSPA
jgi:16S rRNA G527 N7-methylase RsmG